MKNLKTLLRFFNILIFLIITLISSQLRAQVNDDKSRVLISGLQMNVTNDIGLNLKQIMEGIKKAAAEGADFLVTPEGSLSGYTSQFDQKELAHALEAVIAEASRMKVGLISLPV
jgi:apolipoprotein N-acyltransferase